jgi:type IV secretory pathway VirB10-like protein
VERSRTDPTVLLVTYTFEHNHESPKSSSCHQQGKPSQQRPPVPKPEPVVEQAELGPEDDLVEPEAQEPEPEPEEQKVVVSLVAPETASTATVAPVAEEDESFDFGWFDQYPTWHRSSAAYASLLPPEEWERELQGEDALFAGLGELPECAVVFGRRRELSLEATAPCS